MRNINPSLRFLALLFSLTSMAETGWAAARESLLHVFSKTDGAYPQASLIMDGAGNLYGTTWAGGDAQCDCGVVFELSPGMPGKWTETVLYQFHGEDGANPAANLTFDANGNLYGTTAAGGERDCSGYEGFSPTCGLAFELSPNSKGMWTETVLYKFHGADGAWPFTGMIFDTAGNLYGTTLAGGNGVCGGPCGVAFELSPSGATWTEAVLHSFQYSDGASPLGTLVFGEPGVLYGTTALGGTNDGGVVFKLQASQGGEWTEQVLYEFNPNGGQGDYGPYCALVLDGSGSLYGTTMFSTGSAFKVSDADGNVTETAISNLSGGLFPAAGLTFDSHGNLYGTTQQGGKGLCAESGCGIVFELIRGKNGRWHQKVLHKFSDRNGDGIEPVAGVILDGSGNLYGTTSGGGPLGQFGYGAVFEIAP